MQLQIEVLNCVMCISPSKFCRRSVKQLGKKSGKTRCIAPNTRTCPIGDSGMRRMITTGINVIVSLNVRLWEEKRNNKHLYWNESLNKCSSIKQQTKTYRKVRTSLGFNVYPCEARRIKLVQNNTSSENSRVPLT